MPSEGWHLFFTSRCMSSSKKIRIDTALLKKGKRSKPFHPKPMLATKIAAPFNDPDWTYEVKWDGFRILVHIIKNKVTLFSRSLLDYTTNYPVIVNEFSKLNADAIIDGELVVLDDEGKPSFDELQAYDGKGTLVFYAFDLLWLNGYDVTGLQLTERKKLLSAIIPKDSIIRYSNSFEEGISLFDESKKIGLEGIVAKKKDSKYIPGLRSNDWLKVATAIHREFVIGGWTESDKSPYFRALVFGEYVDGKLMYVGHAGGGFKSKDMPVIAKKLRSLEIKKSPFANEVVTDHPVHFVKPILVAEIKFATYTKAKRIRKPAIFIGWRKDKKAEEVISENAVAETPVKPIEKKIRKIKLAADSNWKEIDKQKITSRNSININGKEIELLNIEKNLWKDVTKAELIKYYHEVAEYILPHLKDRPLSLHIKPYAPTQPGFYVKDMEDRQPEWAEIFSTPRKHKKKGKRNTIDYLLCNDEATLIYLINLGCIDINPWTSRTADPLHPDYIIIDLDPSDDDFNKAIETAIAAKEYFKKKKLEAFPKTSGKTGMHLYIPCSGFTFPECRSIAEKICDDIHAMVPRITTTEVSVSGRGNKLYLDPNQNDEADTVAAPYSIRPAKQPTVSTPLEWEEIKHGLSMLDFTIFTIQKRLKKKGDLFGNVLSPVIQQGNNKALKSL
jgi:bifunctional non-homologous end joining protein LigD